MTIQTDARNATLADIVDVLRRQHDAKLDAVVPATAIRSVGGVLYVDGMNLDVPNTVDEMLAAETTPPRPGRYVPTAGMLGDLAEKLSIPVAYLRRLHDERVDLFDSNVNGWLHGKRKRAADGTETVTAPADSRRMLLRSYTDPDGGPGIARALLSDRFRIVDNLDSLTALLQGIKDSGYEVDFNGIDVTDRRMVVRAYCPTLAAAAPALLKGYRPTVDGVRLNDDMLNRLAEHYSPEHLGWDRSKGETPPVLFAGIVATNSEIGDGAWTLGAEIVMAACRNGLRVTKDVIRSVHVGAELPAGQIVWSADTQQKNIELITAQTRDAVGRFLSQEYLDDLVASIDAKAGVEIAKPNEAIEVISKQLKFTDAERDLILDHFIRGGQMTAGGVLNAVTAAAQELPADAAYDMSNVALTALDLAAAL